MFSGNSRANPLGQRLKRWWPWLVLSAILHLPLTPLGPLFGLLALLVRMHATVPDEPVEELVGIPVEILAAPAAPLDSPRSTSADDDAIVIAPPKPKPAKKPKPEPIDAGLPDADVDADVDASHDASVADGSVATDAGMDAGALLGSSDAGTGPGDAGIGDAHIADAGIQRHDPFAIAGELGRFQQGNVNVRVHFFVDVLKNHPAGGAIAQLLAREPQWQQFLGPGGLDPLNDFSKIVLMGPQLVDSSQVGIFLEYKAEPAAMRKAVDALVQRTEGAHWETQNKKHVAYVNAAGGDRVIVLYPNRGVAIVPPKLAEQMIGLSKFPPLATPTAEQEILQVMLKTPHRVRAFKRIGVNVPKSVAMARVFVGGTANGGATIRLELDDASADAAATHAPELEQELARLTMGLFSLRLRPEGAQILGEAQLSPLIVGGVLREVQKRLLPKQPDNPD